jgi:hypothetical protein
MTTFPFDLNDYRVLIDGIAAGDMQSQSEMRELLSGGVRFFLARELPCGQDVADELGNVFSTVVTAIQHGELREPERFLGFVLSVIRLRVAAKIKEMEPVKGRRASHRKEAAPGDEERKHGAMLRFSKLAANDREILMRFYLRQQSPKTICQEMGLTKEQFLLCKGQAKAHFAERKKVG